MPSALYIALASLGALWLVLAAMFGVVVAVVTWCDKWHERQRKRQHYAEQVERAAERTELREARMRAHANFHRQVMARRAEIAQQSLDDTIDKLREWGEQRAPRLISADEANELEAWVNGGDSGVH